MALPPGSPLPRINGGRPRTNEYLFDGISVLQPEPGQVAFFPNIDAIQEFKIESNSPPAEFGRFNGGVVNLTTKAGTNAFHGTAFEFLRNEALNARNFFARPAPPSRSSGATSSAASPADRSGADRTFFFVDYQGQRQTIGRTVISTVPTLLQRQGIFTEAIGGRVPVDLRSRDDHANRRRRDAHAVSRQRDSRRPDRSGRARRCCSAIRCRPAPAPRTTTGASTTRRSTRISSTSGSIISFRQTAIRCSAG